jgi:phage shock protein E
VLNRRKPLAEFMETVLGGDMKQLLPAIVFGLMAGLGFAEEKPADDRVLKLEQAERKLAGGIQLLDVRTKEEWDEGRLKDAVLVPVTDDWFVEKAKATLDPEKPVLVYCRSGGRSARAAKELREAGFTSVYEIKGGVIAWGEAGKPLEK